MTKMSIRYRNSLAKKKLNDKLCIYMAVLMMIVNVVTSDCPVNVDDFSTCDPKCKYVLSINYLSIKQHNLLIGETTI